MLPSLPILVFATLFMMWSRTSLASAKPSTDKEEKAGNTITVEIVAPDKCG